MKGKPVISVIMATYNDNPQFLKIAIDSIINQSYKNFELIIIDDSTDEESKNVIDLYNEDERVRIVRNPEKLGFVPSLNKGLSLARGKFIARMDGDDYSFPDRFRRQLCHFVKHRDCDILGGQINIIDENGNLTGKRNYPLKGAKLTAFFLVRSPLAHPTVMFKRKIIDAGFKYDETLKKAEDIDFWLRLYNAGYKFENIKNTILNFRIDSSFMEKRVSNKAQEDNVVMIRKRSFSFRRPFFSMADYMIAVIRHIVPDNIKANIYKKENGENK